MKGTYTLHEGDSKTILPTLQLVDSIVTDPPYGISFMGKTWDYDVPSVELWTAAYHALKPGGYLLAFASPRTYHRMAVNIEDAGFKIRDQIVWLQGQGFPAGNNIAKSIDKKLGAKRSKVPATGNLHNNRLLNDDGWNKIGNDFAEMDSNEPITDEAKQWQGWNTTLKPACEPIVLARKPFKGTVAENVLDFGTGALNIDACRIPMSQADQNQIDVTSFSKYQSIGGTNGCYSGGEAYDRSTYDPSKGRWPSNVILDEAAAESLDNFTGELKSGSRTGKRTQPKNKNVYGGFSVIRDESPSEGSIGGASRFFYIAKASPAERRGFKHPTIKPVKLMQYLVRLVTPPGGTVLDPFAGTGTTGEAAVLEGFYPILIERDATSCTDIRTRMDSVRRPVGDLLEAS